MMDAARGAEDVPKDPCAFEIQQFFEISPITGTLSLEIQRAPLSYLIDESNWIGKFLSKFFVVATFGGKSWYSYVAPIAHK